MNLVRIKVTAIHNPAMRNILLFMFGITQDGKRFWMKQPEFEEMGESIAYMPDASNSIPITEETAIELMDSLWNIGIRPTDQRDRSGEVNAMKNHIEDLRLVLRAHLARLK